MSFTPTVLQERVEELDILRGFSLLGILLVNTIAFYTPQPYIDLNSWFTDASDIIWHQRLDIYVQSSFYPLFSMLFGYGLAMQYTKAKKHDIAFHNIGIRRMLMLFVFGVLHALLLWWGDILMTYAICGMFLLIFVRFHPFVLLLIAIALNMLFHVMMLMMFGSVTMLGQVMETSYLDIVSIERSVTAYGAGTFLEAFSQRVQDTVYQNNVLTIVFSFMTILPYMLLGAAASKWEFIEKAKNYKVAWIIVGGLLFGFALMLKNAPFMFERTYLLDYLKVYVGGPMMSVGYIGLIVSLCFIPIVATVLRVFSKVGRMSITNYMMQSLVLSLLFYNFGLGLFGKTDVQTGILISIGIFVAQITISEIWLSKFQQGPIEWMWRKGTYGKLVEKK